MTVWIVLPAYNEVPALPRLLARIARAGGPDWHTIVVDDGSTDGTADAARALAPGIPLTVLVHPRNLGLAAAIRTGLTAACEVAHAGDVIVTMDADDTHRPEQIPSLIAQLGAGHDVAIASRYVRGAQQSGVPVHRTFLSAAVGLMLRTRLALPGVRDYSCGYRAYRAGLLQRAIGTYGDRFIEARGFEVMTEILVKLAPFGPRVAEIPLDLRYERKATASKMPTYRTIAGYLRLMFLALPRPAADGGRPPVRRRAKP